MLPALKFVQGAVAKRDFIPALTHFRITGGFVHGFNGTLGICSPIDCDLECAPNAVQLVKAINACEEETISLHVHKGRLVVAAGRFKTHVDCVELPTVPEIIPEGEEVTLPGGLLPALEALEPFIATDASRPWACGVLFDGMTATATNNIVVVQYWIGFQMPHRINLPAACIFELLRMGEEPVRIQLSERRITFHFEGERWISSQLLTQAWPDADSFIEKATSPLVAALPGEFWQAMEKIAPFADKLGTINFIGDAACTEKTLDAGTSVALPVEMPPGRFNVNQLVKIQHVAEMIDFSAYPNPVYFCGEHARGFVLGMKN